MRPTRISSLQAGVAEDPLTDEMLAGQLGIPVTTVAELSRGRLRATAADGIGPAALSAGLVPAVMERRGLATDSVEFLIFGTTTPDATFPGSSCFLQELLELATIGCLDVRSQCTSFLTALDTGSRFVASGAYDRVLVVAADVPTHVLRYDGVDFDLACLMGDGAAVALVEAAEVGSAGEILSISTRIDGSRYHEFWCESPASRNRIVKGAARYGRISVEDFAAGAMFPKFDANDLRETALTRAPETFRESLSQAGLEAVDVTIVAHLLPHVAEELAESLGEDAGRIVFPDTAYSFGSTLPLTLARAAARSEIADGDLVALVTAGAGASWGAAILRW